MSLRYRLFLWVSALFCCVAIASSFMESYVTRKELKIAQQNLRDKLLEASEERREAIEDLLVSSIAESQVMVDAILNNVSIFVPQVLRFGPTKENLANGTWTAVSELLMDYKWLDFLQSTNEEKASSVIIPEGRVLDPTVRSPIGNGNFWIYFDENQPPYLGIQLPIDYLDSEEKGNTEELAQHATDFVPMIYLLFDVEKLKNFANRATSSLIDPTSLTSSIPIAWSEGFSLDLKAFIKQLQSITSPSFVKTLQLPIDDKAALKAQLQAKPVGIIDLIPGGVLLSTATTEKYIEDRLEATSMRFLQANMIWMLIAVDAALGFKKEPADFPAPEAIGLFSAEESVGVGLRADNVFFSSGPFDDKTYYLSHAPKDQRGMLATSCAVITDPKEERAFLGNTAILEVKDNNTLKTGYLTLGIDADNLLQKLVLALHRSAFLVHKDKVISSFDRLGKKTLIPQDIQLPLSSMLDKKYGFIDWNQKSYFFLHMQPFPNVDLHFFLLNTEEEEFALLRDLEEGSEQIVRSILLDLHLTGLIALVIVIIVLHKIAKRITQPIIQLADATKHVVAGRYDQIELHLPPLRHQDEIAVLCHSFQEMIKGLREKEKVKGVLNKVVSEEIAQEILKGVIHLGGEEKKVTVLFADIRGFTAMTQHSSPEEVIELLNTCMTKISQSIDERGGVIDKYVGDEAMALFGAPVAIEDAAFKAIEAAVGIIKVLKEWNQERTEKKLPPIEMGIGIHTGVVLAGNMGGENRLNYTVLGSNVNLAARLCDVAKGMEILITKETLDEIKDHKNYLFESKGQLTFKGFDQPIEVFCVRVD